MWRLAIGCMIVLLAGPVRAAETADFGRYHALVIGIADYHKMPKLETPLNDASAVHDLLRQRYGYRSTLLLNPTREKILRALDGLRAELNEQDNLLIYYAGHGVLERASGTGFWLPVDADRDSQVNWIDVPTISRVLGTMLPRHVMVVADSCYSGTLVRDVNVKLQTGSDRLAVLKRLAGKRSRTALVSGGLEPVVDSGGGGHSVFARAFIETLRDNDTVLEGAALLQKVRRPVVLAAKQTPEYSDIRFAGHDGGDFLFVPAGLKPAAAAPAAPAQGAAAPRQAPLVNETALDLAFWDSVKDSRNAADFDAYLRRFPRGTFAALARSRLDALSAPPAPAATATPFAGKWEGEGQVPFSGAEDCPNRFNITAEIVGDRFAGKAYVGSRGWELVALVAPDGSFQGSIQGAAVGRLQGKATSSEIRASFSDSYGECAGQFTLTRAGN